jgi:hypothetical protein
MDPTDEFKNVLFNYIQIKIINPLVPWINERIEKKSPVTAEEIMKFLQIEVKKEFKQCKYVFKKGSKINQQCTNACIDGKDYCFECIKKVKNNSKPYQIAHVRPDLDNQKIFYDEINGFKLELLPDCTVRVKNVDELSEEQKRKAQSLGYRLT